MIPEGATADFLPTRATIWILYFLDSRNLEKKSHTCLNNHMEDHGNKVIKLHATLSQTISKFTSKTNQEYEPCGGAMGALGEFGTLRPPFSGPESSPGSTSRPLGVGPRPLGPCAVAASAGGGENTLSRGSLGGYPPFPPYGVGIAQMAPLRGPS